MLHIYIFHEVEKGDTMLDIVARYKLNFVVLMGLNPAFNSIMGARDVNRIQVGELIRIQ